MKLPNVSYVRHLTYGQALMFSSIIAKFFSCGGVGGGVEEGDHMAELVRANLPLNPPAMSVTCPA